MSRCLYNSSFEKFINTDENSIFGALCDNYHGDALTTTREAWKSEILQGLSLLQKLLKMLSCAIILPLNILAWLIKFLIP